jgi:hypothetical protein
MLKKAAYRGSKLHNAILQLPSTAASGELKLGISNRHKNRHTFQSLVAVLRNLDFPLFMSVALQSMPLDTIHLLRPCISEQFQ